MCSAKSNLIIGNRILVFNHGLLPKIQALLCAHFDHLLLVSSPESTLVLLLSTILAVLFFVNFFNLSTDLTALCGYIISRGFCLMLVWRPRPLPNDSPCWPCLYQKLWRISTRFGKLLEVKDTKTNNNFPVKKSAWWDIQKCKMTIRHINITDQIHDTKCLKLYWMPNFRLFHFIFKN